MYKDTTVRDAIIISCSIAIMISTLVVIGLLEKSNIILNDIRAINDEQRNTTNLIYDIEAKYDALMDAENAPMTSVPTPYDK